MNQAESAKTKHSTAFAWTFTVVILATVMSAFAYIRLSPNPVVFPIAFMVLTLLQLVRVIHGYKAFSKLGVTFEIGLFGILLWGVVSSYVWDVRAHPAYVCFLLFWLLCSKFKTVLGDKER